MKEKRNLPITDPQSGFRLPDGYFDALTQRVMDRLPSDEASLSAAPQSGSSSPKEATPAALQPEEITLWQRVRPWIYLAALFAGAAFIIRVASPSPQEKADRLAREESESEEMEYINNALDGAMMDDYSLYVYLADESTDNP